MEIVYLKCNPGGNITALVQTKVKNSEIVRISKEIMKQDPEIEQVGFIQKPKFFKDADARLQMMGGEFCGNATRCLAWFLYTKGVGVKKEDATIVKLEVSGVNKILEAKIDKNDSVEVTMPIKEELSCVKDTQFNQDNQYIPVTLVEMEGITHALINMADLVVETEDEVKSIFQKLNLLEKEASGVIFYQRLKKSKIKIRPYLWVKDTETLIAETGCASGTIALVQAESKKKKKTVTLNIIQPSTKEMIATVIFENNLFVRGTIKGRIKIVGEYSKEY